VAAGAPHVKASTIGTADAAVVGVATALEEVHTGHEAEEGEGGNLVAYPANLPLCGQAGHILKTKAAAAAAFLLRVG